LLLFAYFISVIIKIVFKHTVLYMFNVRYALNTLDMYCVLTLDMY